MIIPDKKKAATIIISQMAGYPEESDEDGEGSDEAECEALGSELLDAIASKDPMAAYDAIKAIFLKVDVEPHAEYDHDDE